MSRHKGMHKIHQILKEHPGCIPWPIPDLTKTGTFYCDAEVADELIPLLRKNGFIPRSIALDEQDEIGFGPNFDCIEIIDDVDGIGSEDDVTDGEPIPQPQAERIKGLFQSSGLDLDHHVIFTEEDRPPGA